MRGAACFGTVVDNACVAVGSFCKTDDCSSQVPGSPGVKHALTVWTYPASVFQDMQQESIQISHAAF